MPATAPEAILEVEGVSIAFGGVRALADVNLSVNVGECVGVIGPNGAGKSTLLNCLSGIYESPRDSIRIAGERCGGAAPSDLVLLGVKRTFQNIETFREMSVREVLEVGAHHLANLSIAGAVLRPWRAAATRRRLDEAVARAAALVGLDDILDEPVAELPYGVQKRVDLARALVGETRLLLLDEPAAGLSAPEIDEIGELIPRLHATAGLGMLLVEHHLDFVRRIADRLYVLESGRVIAAGPPEMVLEMPEVIEAYIGLPLAELD